MGKHCGQHGERPDKKVGPGGDDHLKGGGGHDCLLGRAGHDGWKAAPDIVATVPASDPDAGGALTDALTDDAGGLSHSMTTVIGVSFANSGDDALSGGEGDDELDGGAGNDRLFCSMGNEVLAGGDGDDILSGSTGADRFVFHAADQGLDTVTDFGTGDVLVFTGLTGFTAGREAEYVSLVESGGSTTVLVDVDGAANGSVFDPVAVLTGSPTPRSPTFVNAGRIDIWATT